MFYGQLTANFASNEFIKLNFLLYMRVSFKLSMYEIKQNRTFLQLNEKRVRSRHFERDRTTRDLSGFAVSARHVGCTITIVNNGHIVLISVTEPYMNYQMLNGCKRKKYEPLKEGHYPYFTYRSDTNRPVQFPE